MRRRPPLQGVTGRLPCPLRGRRRGRPPRLLHVEPRPPGRLGHRGPAAGGAARRGERRRGPRRTRTSCSRPGPGHPADPVDFAVGREVLLAGTRPVLGVCLGMQGLVTAYGGTVERVEPAHGDVATVTHDGRGRLRGAARTASRRCATTRSPRPSLPDELVATAWSADGVVMGVRHRVAAARGRAVPPRVDPLRARPRHRRELPGPA